MKKYNGNLIITEENKNDFKDLVEITGSLNIRSDAKLPNLQTVGGWLDIRSDAKLPNLQTVGGWLGIYSDAKLPNLQTVGGGLDIRSDAKLPNLQTVGGGLDIRSDAKLPNLQTVGGGLGIRSDAKLEAPKAKYNQKKAFQLAFKCNFECFMKSGFLFADNILARIITKKKNVYKIQIVGQTKISYCIEVDGNFSHGATLKEAKESLIYKITDRDKSDYEDYTLDTEVTHKEAIKMYRVITGACESGTRHFVENVLAEKKEKYTVKEIIKLTEGQYGNETLEEFMENKNK